MPDSTRTRIKNLLTQSENNLERSLEHLVGVLELFESYERQEAHTVDMIMKAIHIAQVGLEQFNKSI